MLTNIDKKYKIRRIFDVFAIKINPDIVSSLALVTAIIAGYLFYRQSVLLATFFIMLNGFLDVLDGQIAKKYGASKLGDFLDHAFDRLADVFILTGISLSGLIPMELGFGALITLLLVSYLGTQAQAISKKRLYLGLLGRADRLVILIIIGLIYPFYNQSIYYGILIILILSILTFFQRFILIKKVIS
jgi:phosphatidylglycerophosphate synthase